MTRATLLMLAPLLMAFQPAPVLGPEFALTLQTLLADPDLPVFEGAQIDRSRVELRRGTAGVILVHRGAGGRLCGPFGIADRADLTLDEENILCARLAVLEDPFVRPEVPPPPPAPPGPQWTYERRATVDGATFGRAGAMVGALAFLSLLSILWPRENGA
ncbi:MAG: hypothetical protein AAGE52_01650 [Myxococcota bacterium]